MNKEIVMPNRQTLRIEFRGICTHFHHDVLPAIPHRVVIPDATPKRRGALALTGTRDWYDYELQPHTPTITMENFEFANDGLFDGNELRTRSALRIENAVGGTIEYPDGSFEDEVRSLSEFVDTFTYASSVVFEGRAFAYFDFHSGVTFTAKKYGEQVVVLADVTTDGAPLLRITAFSERELTQVFELSDTRKPLVIANECTSARNLRGKVNYDYVLHFLSERGGIPRFFKKALPGMTEKSSDLDAACSDSRYP